MKIEEYPITTIEEYPIEQNKIREFPVDKKIEEVPMPTLLDKVKDVGKKVVTGFIPPERFAPLTSILKTSPLAPIEYMIPPIIKERLAQQEMSGMTSPAGIVGTVAGVSPAIRELSQVSRVAPILKPSTPVTKITQAIKEAGPIRKAQEELYTLERGKRIKGVVEAGGIPGEAGYFKQLEALKGELPKVQFQGIRDKISQMDIDSLFTDIEASFLTPFEKVTTKSGLSKLLGAEGGIVPTKNELKLLSEIFPQEFINTVLTKRPVLQKVGEGIEEVLNVPRAIMSSVDMSAPLRQGIFLIGRPKQWVPAFGNMFKYFFNEKSYQGLIESIQKRPTYPLMRESNLSLTNLGRLIGREERFMSNLAERIPIAGKLVRASSRAYTGFLDKLRADTFDDLVKTAQKQNIPIQGKVLNDISSFINTATGRGSLGELDRAAIALNSVFFSPRLMASRLNLLNPMFYIKLSPMVRKEALKSLFTFAGTAMSVTSLAKMGGAKVESDPRNADFAKIKVGNTRYDILGGFQQYVRLAAQLITGEHISSTTGVKTTVGEGYKPITRLDILSRFVETKEAPVTSFVVGLMKGQNTLGEKVDIPKEMGQRFVPMVIQDMYDLYKEGGLKDLAMVTPAFFGAGVQTYSPTANQMVYSANSVLKYSKDLKEQGKIDESQTLVKRNLPLVSIGKTLEPYQKILNLSNQAEDFISKNVAIPPLYKKILKMNIKNKRKEIQKEMDLNLGILKQKYGFNTTK